MQALKQDSRLCPLAECSGLLQCSREGGEGRTDCSLELEGGFEARGKAGLGRLVGGGYRVGKFLTETPQCFLNDS